MKYWFTTFALFIGLITVNALQDEQTKAISGAARATIDGSVSNQ
ncbi:hypothetical protein ACVW0P_002278 [Mucilaginibacter sp. UYNi724]